MDDYIDPAVLGPEEKFAIGQPVPRSEDPVLLRGEGHYADDISLPGQAYAVMVRSHIAHGIIATSTRRRRGRCRGCSPSTPPPIWPRPASAPCPSGKSSTTATARRC